MNKLKIKKHISLNLEICISHDISYPEWILCEQIQFLSVRKGYCYARRDTLAEALKMTTRGLQKMIARLVDKGLLERRGKSNLAVTEKWLEFQEMPDIRHEQSSDNETHEHEQSSHQTRTKFTPRHEQSSPPTIKRDTLSVDIEEKNTKKEKVEYKVLIDKLQKTAKRKSKCKYTENGLNAYLQIEDKTQIAENYLKHQELKGQFAQTIENFLLDYEANIAEILAPKQQTTGYSYNNEPEVGSIAWRMMQEAQNEEAQSDEIYDIEVENE